mmetsp:Transcript_108323/g.338872  ORF Transcript_108323/g.338872 Transcript_108323/m.338872 type:complete len:215 (+) Transcript_108323:1147-1791(+)
MPCWRSQRLKGRAGSLPDLRPLTLQRCDLPCILHAQCHDALRKLVLFRLLDLLQQPGVRCLCLSQHRLDMLCEVLSQVVQDCDRATAAISLQRALLSLKLEVKAHTLLHLPEQWQDQQRVYAFSHGATEAAWGPIRKFCLLQLKPSLPRAEPAAQKCILGLLNGGYELAPLCLRLSDCPLHVSRQYFALILDLHRRDTGWASHVSEPLNRATRP